MEIKSDYSVFDYVGFQQTNMDQMSQNALGNAIDLYQDGDYKAAIKEFQRSIAMSPYSENIIETYDFMANAYLQLEDSRGAENAYKTAIRLNPQREDMYTNLGNLYYSQDKFAQADEAYRNAVRIYPSSETIYSLAHCCLGTDKLDEAEQLFEKVIQMEPGSENGYYGLGMTYAKKEEYEKAIKQFETALELNPDFDDGRVELGYAYTDFGDFEKANEQYETLHETNTTLSSLLKVYMHEVEKPKFNAADRGDFIWDYSIRTPITALDNYLNKANETSHFTVSFTFSKDMDVNSVQNPDNWKISPAEGWGASAYNFGLKMYDNEVEIPEKPTSILYDPSTKKAFVSFALQQNEFADAIMDPGHVEFTFSGIDKFGVKMDEDYDSFSRFNGFA